MFCQSDKVTGWSSAIKSSKERGGCFFSLFAEFSAHCRQRAWGACGRYLLRELEEYIFALAFGAFHDNSVFAFAMDADPCSAEIASSAQQQPPEPWESTPMPVGKLRDRAFFHFRRVFLERECVLFTHLNSISPFVSTDSSRFMAHNRKKVKKKPTWTQ